MSDEKKPTFRDHWQAAERMLWAACDHWQMSDMRQMATMLAYERWLNNRPLMTEEDAIGLR